MALWEYFVSELAVDLEHDVGPYMDELDRIGVDGWELVHVHPVVFKTLPIDCGGPLLVDVSVPHAAHVFKRKL